VLLDIRVGRCREEFAYGLVNVRRAVVLAQTMEYLIKGRRKVWILQNTVKEDSGGSVALSPQFVD
jgi:hypothetical protein